MSTTKRTPTHTCPVRGCSTRVADRRAMCMWHWLMLPRELRDDVWYHYYRHPGSSEHMKAILNAAAWVSEREESSDAS